MDEQQQKQLAAPQLGMVGQPVRNSRRSLEPRELRIEQLAGGFLVMNAEPTLGVYERQVIPNTDCLLSFIQKWVGEGQAER